MATIDIPDEIVARLEAVAKDEERSPRALVIDVLLEYAEDREDMLVAEEILSGPRVPAIPLERYLDELNGRSEAAE